MSLSLRLNPDTLPRQSKTVLDVPMECLVGRHKALDFQYNSVYGVPIIRCRACGANLSRQILEGVKSRTELREVEKKARTRRSTPSESLDRLAMTHDEDKIRDPILRSLVEARVKQLEENRQ
jgi:hypothetical protein